MCNKLLLPTAITFVFVGFTKNVSTHFNSLQRALRVDIKGLFPLRLRVALRLTKQRNAVVEMLFNSQRWGVGVATDTL